MRILHVMHYYQPNMGDQDNHLPYQQKLQGNNVKIITSERYYPFDNYNLLFTNILGKRIIKSGIFKEDGNIIERIPILFEYKKSKKVLFNYRIFLAKIIEFSPDVIHFHQEQNLNLLYLKKISSKLNCKIIVDCHSDYQNSKIYNYNLFLVKYFLLLYSKYLDKYVDSFLPINEASYNHLLKVFSIPKNKIIMNRLGTPYLENINKSKLVLEKYGIKNDFVIIVSGKFSKPNRSDLLFNSLKEIQKINKLIKIIIIGVIAPELSNLLVDSFILIPFQKHKNLLEYYSAADLAIFSTATSTILDSMSCSTPTLIYKEKNTNYLLKAYQHDFSFVNKKELVSKVQYLSENIDLCNNEGRNAKKFIDKELTWNKIAKQSIEIYNK